MSSYLDKYLQNISKDKQSKAAIAYLASFDHIAKTAPNVVEFIVKELKDQRIHIIDNRRLMVKKIPVGYFPLHHPLPDQGIDPFIPLQRLIQERHAGNYLQCKDQN